MTECRRNRVPGATYFFTVNLSDRRSDLLIRQIDVLRQAVRMTRAKSPFHTDAWVVLPDHMHCLWTLPASDADFSNRWRGIKTEFSKRILPGEPRSASRLSRGERGIWQRRFWEHTVRDEQDYRTHLEYIHFNPVKHRLVVNIADWQYSSFHRCVGIGFYPERWSGGSDDIVEAGER